MILCLLLILDKVEPGEVEKNPGDFISYVGTPGEWGDFWP